MKDFQEFLQAASTTHGHRCAGQVLGVRMAQAALKALGVDPEVERKRLIVFVETDRCAADAVAWVAEVSLGKRTLKFLDYGKMAATFYDLQTGRAVRVAARESARERAWDYAPSDLDRHAAQLVAYQQMPDEELLTLAEVGVTLSEYDLPGRPLKVVVCDGCGEGINDNREVRRNGATLCRSCAGESYYVSLMGPAAGWPAADHRTEQRMARAR